MAGGSNSKMEERYATYRELRDGGQKPWDAYAGCGLTPGTGNWKRYERAYRQERGLPPLEPRQGIRRRMPYPMNW